MDTLAGHGPTAHRRDAVTRQLLILLAGFAAGTALAGALGAVSLGVAFGVGQIGFALALVWVLLRD